MRIIFIVLLIELIYGTGIWAQDLNEYTVYKSEHPLNIDGKLSEAGWKHARWTQNFVVYNSGETTNTKTNAKMLWDNNYLYIAIECQDHYLISNFREHDSPLWDEDVAEIFIDPDGDGMNYIEFDVNPLGAVTDVFLAKPYYKGGHSNFKWNLKNPKVGVYVSGTLNNNHDIDTSWVCEIALPFNSIKEADSLDNFPPQNNDVWRINFYRYDYFISNNDTVSEMSAWNQTDKRGFHVPERFGRIIFSTKDIQKSEE